MTKPSLYKIGLNNMCFSTVLFQTELMLAFTNGLVILAVCLYNQSDFWVAGCLVYSVVILIANMRVAQKMHNHTWLSTFILLFSIACFYFQFYLEAQFAGVSSSVLYHIFGVFVTSFSLYAVSLLLSVFNMT